MANKPRDFPEMTDVELLQTLLRSDQKARQILSVIPLKNLVEAHQRELDLTPKAYERLLASIELGRRIHESRMEYRAVAKIESPSDAIDFCRHHFRRLITDAAQEEFHIVTLNTKNHVIRSHMITVGTIDASLVHPREVFRPAITDGATALILTHNHPSGDPTPSQEDIMVTRNLANAAKTVGMQIFDHIIVAREQCISIQQWTNGS